MGVSRNSVKLAIVEGGVEVKLCKIKLEGSGGCILVHCGVELLDAPSLRVSSSQFHLNQQYFFFVPPNNQSNSSSSHSGSGSHTPLSLATKSPILL